MPSTPTETDLRLSEQIDKLAEQLSDFRVDVDRRFGALVEQLTNSRVENERRFGGVERELGELEKQLERRFGGVERGLGEVEAKLSKQLADSRVENERRFDSLDREFGELKTEVQLTTRRLGWLIATLILLGASGTGAVIWAVADISWRASAVVAEVQQHDARIDKLESRLDSKLDAIGKQLERLEPRK